MPKIYIRVDEAGVARETVHPWVDPASGYEYTVLEQFGQAYADTLVEITGLDPMPQEWWTYDGVNFHPPVVPEVDPRPAILAELLQIDIDSARPIRSIVIADPSIGQGTAERAELELLETRAAALRAQLAALDNE